MSETGHILVVDDQQEICDLVREYLSDEGFRVSTANDGTGMRDYVHVNDLAQAHLLALSHLAAQPGAHVFNLGNGSGFSALQVVEAARRVTGRQIQIARAPRRAGDPDTLVASSDMARRVLGWQPIFTELDPIVETAWRWHSAAKY